MNDYFKGSLKKWNDSKGFGFIEIIDSSDIFIHISAFKNNLSRRPLIGDVIIFQKGEDGKGKTRAVNASIQGLKITSSNKTRKKPQNNNNRNSTSKWMLVFTVLILTIFAYSKFATQKTHPIVKEKVTPKYKVIQKIKYKCEGKTHCSQMSSCGEAKFYIRHCPNTQMDGDRDGVPCERQWCKR